MTPRWRHLAPRFSSGRPNILSVHYLDLTSLQSECLKEVWPGRGSCCFITTKKFAWRLPLKPHSEIGGESRMSFRASCKKQRIQDVTWSERIKSKLFRLHRFFHVGGNKVNFRKQSLRGAPWDKVFLNFKNIKRG